MALKSFHVFSVSWPEVASFVTRIVPPLLHSEHKGAMGRIGVLGGSKDYTGAPFYSGGASIKFGGDLATILCSQHASIPIKCYSPELMVTPFYCDDNLEYFNYPTSCQDSTSTSSVRVQRCQEQEESLKKSIVEEEIRRAESIILETLPRLHSLVIGPGLGRNEHVGTIALFAISAAKELNKFLVIDADGLWVLNKNYSSIYGYTRCVITPNSAEFTRLVDAVKADIIKQYLHDSIDSSKRNYYELLLKELSSADEIVNTRALSLALGGVTVLRKAEHDMITAGADVFILREIGSPRRCGGQGDILAGCVAVALHWQQKTSDEISGKSPKMFDCAVSEARQSAVDLFDQCEWADIQANERIIMTKTFSASGGRLATAPTSITTSAGADRFGNILSSILASTVVKRAAQLAFQDKKRSMTAPDVLNNIGNALDSLLGST